jgi:hypothetical protein
VDGSSLTPTLLAKWLENRVPNPISDIYEWRDSLSLNDAQRFQLEQIHRRHAAQRGAIWLSAASDLLAMPRPISDKQGEARLRQAREVVWDILESTTRELRHVLTKSQTSALSPKLAAYFEDDEVQRLRRFSLAY